MRSDEAAVEVPAGASARGGVVRDPAVVVDDVTR